MSKPPKVIPVTEGIEEKARGLRILSFDEKGATLYEEKRPRKEKVPFSELKKIAGKEAEDVDLVVLERGEIRRLIEGALRPKSDLKALGSSKVTGSSGKGKGRRRASKRRYHLERVELREHLRGRLQEEIEIPTGRLADQMLPDVAVPSPAKVLSAQREAEARLALLQEFGAFTSEEIGTMRSKAANVHALASRWRAEGKVFSVDFRGRQLFPGFQFDPGSAAPRPVVAEVLAALPRDEMSEWEVALWWVAANEWLGSRRPVDLIDEDPGALAGAAAHLAQPSAL